MDLVELFNTHRGNIMMVAGALLLAYIPFQDKVNGFVKGIFSPQRPDINDDPGSILKNFSVHDIVEILIEERATAGDEEGVVILGSFGKHMYDWHMKDTEEVVDEDK